MVQLIERFYDTLSGFVVSQPFFTSIRTDLIIRGLFGFLQQEVEQSFRAFIVNMCLHSSIVKCVMMTSGRYVIEPIDSESQLAYFNSNYFLHLKH